MATGAGMASTIFQARLNTDGTRDTTFGPAGLIVTDAPVGPSPTTTMFLGADGSLLAARAKPTTGFLNGGWAYLYRASPGT